MVGSGSSGAAIAGRLAQSGASVIVVEAGKSDEKFLVKKPGMIGPMHSVPEIKKTVDWGFYSVPQKHLLDRKMPVPRGKVVGGSSSINGMVYVRGNRANFDDWAAEGNTGWDADTRQRGVQADGGLRGRRGRLPRRRRPDQGHPQQDAAGGLAPVPPGRLRRHSAAKILDDYNARVAGGRQPDAAERRWRAALLAPPAATSTTSAPSGTLQLQRETLTRRVVIENGRAVGIEVRTSARRAPARSGRSGPARRSSSRPASSAPRSS